MKKYRTDWADHAARGGIIWGQEIDVIAVSNDYAIRDLAQCKDWRDKRVPPSAIWRLIALAQTVRAQPVLATTSELTERAREIAERWRVAIVQPPDLRLDHRPRPPKPSSDGFETRLNDSIADELLRRGQVPTDYPRYR